MPVQPKRILIAGEFGRSAYGAPYYNTCFALMNGFVRIGCHVLTFSDRDTAREANIFRRKALGRERMNRSLTKTAHTYRPHVILLGHVDMTGADTVNQLRSAVPGVRIAQFNVDALFRESSMSGFRERARHVDISFVTTGCRKRLAEIAPRTNSMAYFPNPVDASTATANVSQVSRASLAYDGIFLGNGDQRREAQVTELQTSLPSSFRFFAGGKIFGTPRLTGPIFMETLATAAMSPNLPLDETRTIDHLYSSDRIAQLLTQGLVPLCQTEAGLEEIYEDAIVNYTTVADLADKMAELANDDARRRQIAATGWRIGRERTGAERVAQYMLDHILGDGPSDTYGWPVKRV